MGFPSFFWRIFLVPGLLMLAWGAFETYRTWNTQRFIGHARGTVLSTTTTGTLGVDFHASVQFQTPDGRSHTFDSAMGAQNSLKTGRRVPVAYDVEDPDHAHVELTDPQPWSVPVLLSAWGGLFSLLGGIPLYLTGRKARQVDWLKLNGQAVQASFTGVHLNTDLIVNGKSPYRVTAQWQDHQFHSVNLWADPTPHIASKTIVVLLDPKNPKRYWMDLSFLPE